MGNMMDFYWDHKANIFYLANHQEKRYMFIAEKGSPYYDLCMRIYCKGWHYHKSEIMQYRKVDRLEQIDGTED